MHLGALIALVVVAVAAVLLGRTIKGFEIKVVGAARALRDLPGLVRTGS